jgi:hypothetical protein
LTPSMTPGHSFGRRSEHVSIAALNESKEDILAIEFSRVPGPVRIWSEEFDMGNGVEAFVLLPSGVQLLFQTDVGENRG